MKTLNPIATWEGLPWIGPCCAVNDFNGDGRNELLFIQSAGAHANSFFDPRVNNGYGYKTGVEDQELFCMTLADPEGNILWQTGEPWHLERPFSWNGHCSDFCDLVDVDGDGRNEIILVHKSDLRIYDGATGELRVSHSLPNEAFNRAQAIKTDHSGHYHIFTKSGTSSATHSYGNPSLLLDHNLELVWELDNIPGAGHRPNFADFDGDGLDEMVIGFGLYDHDGTKLWAHEPFSKGDHLDDSAIVDIDGDGRLEVAFAHDGHDAVVHNDDGTERFRAPMNHCQIILAGKFFDSEEGQQLIFVDKAVGEEKEREAVVVRHDGSVISRYSTLGYYDPVSWTNDCGPLSLIRAERPPDPCGEFRVVVVEPTGKELARLNVRADFSAHVRKHKLDELHPEYPIYFGAGHYVSIGDVDTDGQQEVIVYDRHTVWVFKES